MVISSKFKVIKQGIEFEFEPAEEGGYIVTVPLYPSCASQGETFEDAMANIEDALTCCLHAAKELNLPIPSALKNY
jgi:predicted RNase H-like HicB family nuclease